MSCIIPSAKYIQFKALGLRCATPMGQMLKAEYYPKQKEYKQCVI